MKKFVMNFSAMTLVVLFSVGNATESSGQDPAGNESLEIWCSPDLKGITETWVNAYSSANPGYSVTILPGNGSLADGDLYGNKSIGLVTSDYMSRPGFENGWSMVIGRSIMVPVVNASNPFLDKIREQGLSPESLKSILTADGKIAWGELLQEKVPGKINLYYLDEGSTTNCLSAFLQEDPGLFLKTGIADREELLNGIREDKYALGFLNLTDILNGESGELDPSVSLVPIDLNGNRSIDHFENIYNSTGDLIRGAWIGKYPFQLQSRIYAFAKEQPDDVAGLAFMDWMLHGGQEYLVEEGYTELIPSEVRTKIMSLYPSKIDIISVEPTRVAASTLLIIILLAFGLLIFFYIVFRRRSPTGYMAQEANPGYGGLNGPVLHAPRGLFYDKSHTWTFMERDGLVRTGIDDFLQHVTGPITKVIMKGAGQTIVKGEIFLSIIQQGKKLEIHSPISGIISLNNSDLTANPSLLNESPYSQGWVYIIEPLDWQKETRAYSMVSVYRDWLMREFTRLKEFLNMALQPEEVDQKQLIMRDGGELRDCLMENLDPKIWEQFQVEFLDRAD